MCLSLKTFMELKIRRDDFFSQCVKKYLNKMKSKLISISITKEKSKLEIFF